MRIRIYIHVLLYVIILNSCSKTDIFDCFTPGYCAEFPEGVPIITDPKLYHDKTSDSYILDTVFIANDVLHVAIHYGGGCERVKMAILSDGETMGLSLPPYVPLRIIFEDDDPCEALIREEFCFDLTSLEFVSSINEVLIHLPDWDEKILWKIK